MHIMVHSKSILYLLQDDSTAILDFGRNLLTYSLYTQASPTGARAVA